MMLDIELDDPAQLGEEGYDLIVMRPMYPFLTRSCQLAAAGRGDRRCPCAGTGFSWFRPHLTIVRA